MTHQSTEIIKKGFRALCRILKNKTNNKKKKYREKIQKDIADVTPETTTAKEFY